jgi:hypothetical protein
MWIEEHRMVLMVSSVGVASVTFRLNVESLAVRKADRGEGDEREGGNDEVEEEDEEEEEEEEKEAEEEEDEEEEEEE